MSSPYPGSLLGATPPERIVSSNLAAVRARARGTSVQQRLAFVGLLLALGMVAVLYQVLNDNIAQLENKRQARLEQARVRHACAMMPTRLERDQCLASISEPSIEINNTEPEDTVLAGR